MVKNGHILVSLHQRVGGEASRLINEHKATLITGIMFKPRNISNIQAHNHTLK